MITPDIVPAAITDLIRAAHYSAHAAAKSAIAHAIHAGELLLQAKAQLPHGSFGPWLRENFAFSERAARGYMQLAGLDEANRQRVADLSLRQALDAIAEPGPEAPAEEVQRLRDEIRGSDDLDEIHPKQPAVSWLPDVNQDSELITCLWNDHRVVVISPSRMHPGFYYAETIDSQTGIVDGMRRPMKQEALGWCLTMMGVSENVQWVRCNPGMGPEL
jgi:hypothetical protein